MKINYPFSNHMVLQRNKDIIIRGEAKGDFINISIGKSRFQGKIINNQWVVYMFLNQTGGPFDMKINSEHEEMIVSDVWVGDVFLAAGQSNMEMPLIQTNDRKDIDFPHNIRVLYVPQYVYPFDEKNQEWQIYNQKTALQYSALIASFVKHIDINIPIGIILNYKGGTSASCWISEEYLKKDAMIYETYWNDYFSNLPSIDKQKQQMVEYYNQFKNYQSRLEKYKQQNPQMNLSQIKKIIGHTPWPPPKGIYDYGQPSCLYKNMFLKTASYPIKAVLYYQGEEDSPKYQYYSTLLGLLIDNWRFVYQDNIPFFIIQLPEYDNSHFGEIRLAQREVSLQKKDVYLVVSLGTGDSTYIHPLCKAELGKRLAHSVAKTMYQKDSNVSPTIQKVYYDYQYTVIEFDQLLQERAVHLIVDGKIIIGNIIQKKIIIPIDCYQYIAYARDDVPDIEIASVHGMPASPFILYNQD